MEIEKEIELLNDILESRVERKLKSMKFNAPPAYYDYVVMKDKICKFKYRYAWLKDCCLEDIDHYVRADMTEQEEYMHLVVNLATLNEREPTDENLMFVYWSQAGDRSVNASIAYLKKKETTRYAAVKRRKWQQTTLSVITGTNKSKRNDKKRRT